MPEWTVCPQCQLKHSSRADGLCPRCKAPSGDPVGGETAPPAEPPPPPSRGGLESPEMPDVYDGRAPFATIEAPSRRASRDGVTAGTGTGARAAGAVLVANGLALIIEAGLGVTMGEEAKSAPGFSPSPVAVLIDIVLGGLLLTGNAKALPWAKIRVVLGALLLPALFFSSGQSVMGALQLTFSAGLALLLFGEAGRFRIAVGVLACGLILGLETLGLVGLTTGTSPLGRLQYAGDLEGGSVDVVDGVAYPYRLTAGGGHWYLRKVESAREDNPLADRWLVWPDRDAHVLVIAEQIEPGLVVDLDQFAEVVLDNARQAAPDLEELGREPLTGGGLRVHTRGTIDGMAIESYYGLYAREPWIFQVYAFTVEANFQGAKKDLGSIVGSFEAPQY